MRARLSWLECGSIAQHPGVRTQRADADGRAAAAACREQQQRELRREQGLPPTEEETLGSFDAGDPTTTNLYIGNLAVDVDEQVLMREFGRCAARSPAACGWRLAVARLQR